QGQQPPAPAPSPAHCLRRHYRFSCTHSNDVVNRDFPLGESDGGKRAERSAPRMAPLCTESRLTYVREPGLSCAQAPAVIVIFNPAAGQKLRRGKSSARGASRLLSGAERIR